VLALAFLELGWTVQLGLFRWERIDNIQEVEVISNFKNDKL
jgi:hypothetical protein